MTALAPKRSGEVMEIIWSKAYADIAEGKLTKQIISEIYRISPPYLRRIERAKGVKPADRRIMAPAASENDRPRRPFSTTIERANDSSAAAYADGASLEDLRKSTGQTRRAIMVALRRRGIEIRKRRRKDGRWEAV